MSGTKQRIDPSLVHSDAWRRTADVMAATLQRVRPYTMVAQQSLLELANEVRTLLAMNIAGNFVECGVWKGGSAFLMAELLRAADQGDRPRDRTVWLFDSFEGLPAPVQIDGTAANAWANDKSSPAYRDNLRVSLDDVRAAAQQLEVSSYTEFVKGWFDQTLSDNRERIGPIALLRIDADWHASVRCCLESLFDQVVDGGLVVLDDYYTWRGCAVAAHEFLGARALGLPIEAPLGSGCGMPAVIRKGETTWHELWQQVSVLDEQRLRDADVASVVPAERALILIGQDGLSDTAAARWRVIPFLERDGVYWGLPEDDETAVREINRLRRAGAQFLVVASSAFWWLDYYRGFAAHIAEQLNPLLHNDRVKIFAWKEWSQP